MKFNPQQWTVLKNGQTFELQGRLHVRSTAQIAVQVTDQFGCTALAGIGHEIKALFGSPVQVTLEILSGDAEADIFVYQPQNMPIRCTGEIFTNVDRMPMESGTMVEVKRALRELELNRRGMLREIRAERAAFRAEKGASRLDAAAEAKEPEAQAPEAEAEPDAE